MSLVAESKTWFTDLTTHLPKVVLASGWWLNCVELEVAGGRNMDA